MLSYRHSFHAGNFADVIKHVVLVEILEHLVQKEAPFEYVDTHSGAGIYDLGSVEAQKLQEHANGIGRLGREHFPELMRYFDVINAYNGTGRVERYPGSPAIAHYFLRPQDRAWLYELHPQDYTALASNMRGNKRIRVARQDGYKGMLAVLPPSSRRGVVLIDPSYEVKSDYVQVVQRAIQGYKKFSTGIFAIWYPVVDRRKIDDMIERFVNSGIKNIQRFELGVSADMAGRGMSSSGMVVINPPWTLFGRMSSLLPKLASTLGSKGEHLFKCDIITRE